MSGIVVEVDAPVGQPVLLPITARVVIEVGVPGNWVGAVTTVFGRAGDVVLLKSDVTGTGLAAADVGADVAGAASTEQTRALAAEALAAQKSANLSDLASAPTSRTNLGLGNVDNTSDANKPVSTAQATADALAAQKSANLSDLASAATARTNLALGNVDNTSDANKPVSTAQAAADTTARLAAQAFATAAIATQHTADNGSYPAIGLARVRGNRTVAMGDSITGFGGNVAQANPGWFFRLCASSLGRINPGDAGCFATGGFTLEQIEATHLPTVLALNPKPGAAFVFGGTNNTGASIGVGFNFATASATLERITSALMAAGIMPILVLIPPRGDDGTGLVQKNVTIWNNYVYLLSQRAGYPLFDAFTPMVDPATGGYLAALTLDQVHPNEIGYQTITDYNLAQGFLENFEVNRPHPALYGEFYNLVPSGDGLFLTNSGGLGTGWAAAGGGTGITTSILTPQAADNLKGNWQRLAQASGSNGNEWIQVQLGSAWAVGDLLSISARLRASGFNACNTMSYTGTNPPTGAVNYGLGVLCVGASGNPQGLYQWTRDLPDATVHYRLTVPVGSTALYVRLLTNGGNINGITAATALDIGEVTVRNLTTLGLVTL